MSKNVWAAPPPLAKKMSFRFLAFCQFKCIRHPYTQARSQFFERQTPDPATRAGAPEGSSDRFDGSQRLANRAGTPGRLRAAWGPSKPLWDLVHCHSVTSTSSPTPRHPGAPATAGAASGPARQVCTVPGEAAASLHLGLRTLSLSLFSLHLTRKAWLAELTQTQTLCSFCSQNHF